MNKTTFMIVAGEVSGDLLGADLIRALRTRVPDAEFIGVTGEQMRAVGCHTLFSMEEIADMGFVDGLKNLPSLLARRKQVLQHALKTKPTVYIGIDAPDFNLAIEQKCRRAGIKTVHYVSPSVWAWRKQRIHHIKKCVDLMLTVLPFETDIYRKHNIPVEFVGHPLADQIPLESNKVEARRILGLDVDKPVLAILPGSRGMEIKQLGRQFVTTALRCMKEMPDLQCVAPMVNDKCRYAFIAERGPVPIKLVRRQARTIMAAADVVLLASGTATLEAMLVNRPMVVAYKMHTINYYILRLLVRLKYISLPNLLANTDLVPEFIQKEASTRNLSDAVIEYFDHPRLATKLTCRFRAMHEELQRGASDRAAEAILKLFSN